MYSSDRWLRCRIFARFTKPASVILVWFNVKALRSKANRNRRNEFNENRIIFRIVRSRVAQLIYMACEAFVYSRGELSALLRLLATCQRPDSTRTRPAVPHGPPQGELNSPPVWLSLCVCLSPFRLPSSCLRAVNSTSTTVRQSVL